MTRFGNPTPIIKGSFIVRKITVLIVSILLCSISGLVKADLSGTVVNAVSPAQALDEDICSYYKLIRTYSVTLDNKTPYGIEIWFAHLKSDADDAPNEDFVFDSGVFVASDGAGTGKHEIDPCKWINSPTPVVIQANICEGAIKIADTNQDFTLPTITAREGEYHYWCGWEISLEGNNVTAKVITDGETRPVTVLSLIHI